MSEPTPQQQPADKHDNKKEEQAPETQQPKNGESGGPSGPEPTRYGDWERKGRCIDF